MDIGDESLIEDQENGASAQKEKELQPSKSAGLVNRQEIQTQEVPEDHGDQHSSDGSEPAGLWPELLSGETQDVSKNDAAEAKPPPSPRDALNKVIHKERNQSAYFPGLGPRGVLVEIENAKRTYTIGDDVIEALDGISLRIRVGDFIALIGPSGSGKSTLMNVIGALDSLTEGVIIVEDEDLSQMEDEMQAQYRRKRIGFVFQSFNLQSELTALENVELPLLFDRVPPRKRRSMALAALQKVGLANRVSHRPSQMSGGQQQRVAIARAIVNKPPILLADEPTGNLDVKSGGEIMNLLVKLNADEGITIIMVTHNIEYAKYAGRVLHMSEGKFVHESKEDKQ